MVAAGGCGIRAAGVELDAGADPRRGPRRLGGARDGGRGDGRLRDDGVGGRVGCGGDVDVGGGGWRRVGWGRSGFCRVGRCRSGRRGGGGPESLCAERRQDLHLECGCGGLLCGVRVDRSRGRDAGDLLLRGAGRCGRAGVRRRAGDERAASARRDPVRRLSGVGRGHAGRTGDGVQDRDGGAGPAASHGGGRGVRDGRPGAAGGGGACPGAAAVRQGAGVVPADSGEARRVGHGAHGRAAARVSRGVGEGPGGRAHHHGSRDGEGVLHGGRAADRGPGGAGAGGAGRDCEPPRRAPLPEREGAADLRGDDRNPAPDHRRRAGAGR